MSELVWDMAKDTDQVAKFRIGGGTEAERAMVAELVAGIIGRQGTIQKAESFSDYYNYRITLAKGVSYQEIHSLLWSALLHTYSIPVRLY